MSKKTTEHGWMNPLSALFVALTMLMIGWFALIWAEPNATWNPFPPQAWLPDLPAPTPATVSSHRPVGWNPYQDGAAFPPTWTPTPIPIPTATPTRWPSPTPTLTPTRRPIPTLPPNAPYYVSGMRRQRYSGGQVVLHGLFGENADFTTYLIYYPSEGLQISGMMNVPQGRGPFPVIILCHGYIHPSKYATGSDTWRQAFYLSKNGYITISPDYRGHAGSDSGGSFYHIGYAEDILNLISSLNTIAKADADRIGLWGHSMGGGVAFKAAVVSDEVDALVLFGTVSGDEEVNFEAGMGNGGGAAGLSLFGVPDYNRLEYRRISPIYYMQWSPPISLHHGLADQVTPYQWSESIFKAAQEAGVASELFLYSDAGHSFTDQDWELAMQRTLAFYDQYVKGGP